jgi:hypothetical protein
MSDSTATADTPLRQAALQLCGMPAGRLALRDRTILFQVYLGLSGLRVPVSLGVLAVSSQTVMNNVG